MIVPYLYSLVSFDEEMKELGTALNYSEIELYKKIMMKEMGIYTTINGMVQNDSKQGKLLYGFFWS